MALIKCVECGKEFSDKANACPNCGCPTEYVLGTIGNKEETAPVPTNVEQNDESTDESVIVPKEAMKSLPHTKENLLSYCELRNFAFSSIVPYINKELNNSITDIRSGTGENNDAHYYIICGQRIIGVKVVIDAYPDVYNVGRFFDDDTNENELAGALLKQGYECAIVHIGIGASDKVRLARRIFLKNDGFYFNYKQLRFVNYNSQLSQNLSASGIRYSLSEAPTDESWKKIVGFEYKKTPKRVNEFAIQKPTTLIDQVAIREFWDDDYKVISKIEKMCKEAYVAEDCVEEVSKLICYSASIAHNKISPEDLLNYVCNALDFVMGVFLSDSMPVAKDKILSTLRDLITKMEFESKYELECKETTLINYLIYIFITDRERFQEFFREDYMHEYQGRRLSSIGYIYHATKDAFLENPYQFGYGKDVVDEISRIQNINSQQNLDKYMEMGNSIKAEISQFCVVHEKVISKKAASLLDKTDEVLLGQFSQNVLQLQKFIQDNFDERLVESHRNSMIAFNRVLNEYKLCLGKDRVIIEKYVSNKYGFFERTSDVKESKMRFEKLMVLCK